MAAAALMVAAQAGLRAWALYPSWFYTDDYRLLSDARSGPLTISRLLEPFDSQFMPMGRAVAWLVSGSDANWALAASTTLAVQVLAGAACAWMLFTLFGTRPWALAPLALYLSSALTMPALMWWAAALNQLPLQAVFFLAVGAWVRYARSRRPLWLAVTLLALAVGLLFYVKTALVFPVLAYLLLAYFSRGSVPSRVWQTVRTYWPALLTSVGLAAAFAYYYVTEVPSIFIAGERPVAGDLAESMLGRSLATGLLGGPWRWDVSNPPTGYADPPGWATSAAWIALVLFAVGAALVRRRTGRAWVLLGGYAAVAFVLVLSSRAPVAGAVIGLELRYLTDLVPVAALCLGLVTMPMLGAVESSEPRDRPLLTVTPSQPILAVAVLAIVISGTWSGISYARIWHDDHPGAAYTQAVMSDLRGDGGTVELADQIVPHNVVPGFSNPYNTTRVLLPLLVDGVRFPAVSGDLRVLDEQGHLRPAVVEGVTSTPGPADGCGWQVRSVPMTVPLESTAFDYEWWVSIGYLAPQSGTLEVRAGDSTREVPVHRGLGTAFVRVDGEVDEVVLQMQDEAVTLCVDKITVGEVKAMETS